MLKRKIDKDTYDELSDEFKKLYKEKDGSYHLDVEGDDNNNNNDDAAELRRAKQREAQKAKDEKKRADELQAKLDEITGDDARKRGDIDALEKSWKEKFDKREKELTDEIATKDRFIERSMIDGTVAELSTKLCGDKSSLIKPHLAGRLAVEFDGNNPVLKVLDKDGKVSANTIEDLEKEFVANKDFSSIIVGSKASGSGAPKDTTQKGHGGAPLDASGKPTEFRNLSVAEKVAHLKAKKEASNQEG